MQRCSKDPNSSSAEPGAVVLSRAQFIEAFGFPFKIIAILPWGQLKVKTIANAAEIEAALKWAEHENKAGANIYFEPNESRRPHHKSGDDDIVCLRSIKADIDPKDGRTVEDCRAVVNGLTPAPSIVVFSGGGIQLHYLLQGRVDVSHVALYRAAGLGLQKLTGGDSVSEPSRAMRLPGFINHPYQPSKRGRGPKLAEVVSATLQRYTLEELDEAFEAGGQSQETAGKSTARLKLVSNNTDLGTPPAALAHFAPDDNSDLTSGWFKKLSDDDQNAALKGMLAVPDVVALADTEDTAPEPNWRTVVAACVRSGAPMAFDLCKEWAETSKRFTQAGFNNSWRYYVRRDPERGYTIGMLIKLATDGGWDAEPWRAKANGVADEAQGEAQGEAQLPAKRSTASQFGFGDDDDDQSSAFTQAPAKQAPAKVAFDPDDFDVANRVASMPPPRKWFMRPFLIAKYYSMLIATGGGGKSAVAITMALSLATGRDLLGMPVDQDCKVVIINGEDGSEEIMRRIQAACINFQIAPTILAGRLFIVGAREIPGLTFNCAVKGGVVADEKGLAVLAEIVERAKADVIILDPFGSFVPGGMNDGASASAVAGRITEICVKNDCAMLLIHHVSKAAIRGGDNDSTAAMGSAMWTNHARAVANLQRATVEEAREAGFAGDAQDMLVLTPTKANLSRMGDPTHLRMVSVELPNAAPPRYPSGDRVGVADQLTPRPFMSLFKPAIIKAVLDKIDAGTATGIPYKATGRKGAQDYRADIAAILSADFPKDKQKALENTAVQLVEQLLAEGKLVKITAKTPRSCGGHGGDKTAEVMKVNWPATEWSQGALDL